MDQFRCSSSYHKSRVMKREFGSHACRRTRGKKIRPNCSKQTPYISENGFTTQQNILSHLTGEIIQRSRLNQYKP